MKTSKKFIKIGIMVLSLGSIQAKGQTFDALYNSASPAKEIKGTFDNGANTREYLSGVLNLTTNASGTPLDFLAFCVEPHQGISTGSTYTYQIEPNSHLAEYDDVAKLVGGYLALAAPSDEEAAAFQWAIWEVTNEQSATRDLGANTVRIHSDNLSTRNLANSYLANINTFTAADITYITNPNSQDLVAWHSSTPVPEPTALGMLAFGGLLLVRRKRN